jgi:hypothetical protein
VKITQKAIVVTIAIFLVSSSVGAWVWMHNQIPIVDYTLTGIYGLPLSWLCL